MRSAIMETAASAGRTATRLQKCYDCGATMNVKVENYRYLECGLKNVVLKGIPVFRCRECGAEVPEIVAASVLHSLIGIRLLFKPTRLNGDEVRFLRKLVGYSATQLAELAGTSKAVVSRWETKNTLGPHTDRLIRMICVNKILQDAMPADRPSPNPTKTLMDTSVFTHLMETLLKNLRNKKESKTMEIERRDLERLAAFSGPIVSLQAAALQ